MLALYLLLSLMILGSLVAIHTRSLLSAVISLSLVGLVLSVTFLYLQTPDIAITQIIVEIVALVILIRAVATEKEVSDIKGKKEVFSLVAVVVFIVIFGYFAYRALTFVEFPKFGYPVMKVAQFYVEEGLKRTGSANLITSVVLGFRGYDTLGEATVLFAAVLGTLVILRGVGRKK
ncbi:MAG: hydrogen gas-evolving membrane-bound hydrogenase subunit E [bacterium]